MGDAYTSDVYFAVDTDYEDVWEQLLREEQESYGIIMTQRWHKTYAHKAFSENCLTIYKLHNVTWFEGRRNVDAFYRARRKLEDYGAFWQFARVGKMWNDVEFEAMDTKAGDFPWPTFKTEVHW